MAEVRFGDVVYRDGKGYSEMAPSKEEVIRKTFKLPTKKSGGSSGGGGSSSNKDAQLKKEAEIRQAEILAEEQARQKQIAEQQIAQAETQAEKLKLARIYVENQKSQAQLKKVLQDRARLIKSGATTREVISKDIKTGDRLQVTVVRDKTGQMVNKIVNLNTGTTTYTSYKRPKGGGSVRQTGGVDFGGQSSSEVKQIKNELVNSGLIPITNKYGQVTGFKSKDTGKTYVYSYDGITKFNKDIQTPGSRFKQMIRNRQQTGMSIMRQDGKLEEANSWFLNKKIQNRIQVERLEKEIKRLKSQGRKKEALKLAQEKQKLKNELVGYTVGQRVTQFLSGAKEIPGIAKTIYQEPRAIVPISLAILQGVRADLVDTWQLAKTSPGQAVAKIGTDYFTFAIIGKVLKVTGKVTGKVAKKLNPQWVKIGSGRIRIKVPKKAFTYLVRSTTIKKASKSLRSFKAMGKKSDIGKSIEKVGRRIDNVQRKIDNVQRKISVRKLKIKKYVKKAKTNVRLRKELRQTMINAKKIRRMARKKGETVYIKGGDYKRAIVILEDLSDAIAKVRAVNFIRNYVKNGGEITSQQANALINAVKNKMRSNLYKMDDFKKLKSLEKYSQPEAIKLIRIGKIKSAKIFLSNIIKRLEKMRIVKEISLYLKRIKNQIKKPIKRVSRFKGKIRKQISTAKTNVRLKKARKLTFKRAKKIRRMARKKGETVYMGNNDFSKTVNFLEDFSDKLAEIKIKKYFDRLKSDGVELSSTNKAIILRSVKKFLRKELERSPDFIRLKNTAELNKPYTIKLIKLGKIKSAKILGNKIISKIKNIPLIKRIKFIERKIIKYPSKIQKKIKRKRLQAISRKEYMKTNRYKMEKARPIREVTLDQLSKSSDISKMNRFIDYFFDNMGRKQKINISGVRFKQIKNLMKKRMAKAIKRNDAVEISNFRKEINKLISDMNKKESNPDVIVVEKIGKSKRFRTIKNFEAEAPKGTFVEVKVGNQVLLQKVKTKMESKMAPQQMQSQQFARQKMKIVSVKKKAINLRPLIMFGVKSLSASAIRNMMKSKQGFFKLSNQAQLFKTLQDSAQDLKILQAVAQDVMSTSAVAQAVAQDVNSNIRPKLKQKTQQIYKKKEKKLKIRLLSSFSKKKVSKSQQTYYVVEKVRGKFKRLYPGALSLSDAKDYAVYSIDNRLSKTAFFIPSEKSKNIAVAPRNIQGYASKNSQKVRPYKIRFGKKRDLVNGFIEKRKYFQDTSGERIQAARLRARSRRKTIKRTPTRKIVRRKISPMQRRILIARLKKARAVRMRNLRRK